MRISVSFREENEKLNSSLRNDTERINVGFKTSKNEEKIALNEPSVEVASDLRIKDERVNVDFGSVQTRTSDRQRYEGPYSVTPTRDTQILETNGKYASENIVVNPIPYYYGLITWDGSVLTVS